MVYFSELLGKEIYDIKKKKVGVVRDFCFKDAVRYAKITGIIINDNRDMKLSWKYVAGLGDYEKDPLPFSIYLNVSEKNLKLAKVVNSKVSDILDKQIIDVNGARVVRVNDVLLGKVGRSLAVIGVSIGTQGLFRRLGVNWLANKSKEHIIMWKDVAPLSTDIKNLQIKQRSERINELHASEIASLIKDLTLEEKLMLFNNLSQEKAAKTLLKSQPEVRQGVFKTLSMKKIASLLEIMPSHEAAAILSMMPLVHNSKVLKLMKPGIADKIGKLLQYDKRTAGALMSTRYIAISENFNVNDLTELIKKLRPQSRHIHYIYITDDFGKLKGVVSMKYVVMSEKDAPIKDIMKTDVITVSPKTDIDDVFNIITRYDLTAVPVVDKEKKLLGVIRVHDMFEILVPSRIKNRIIKAKRLSSNKNG
jgi:magnesium transporter